MSFQKGDLLLCVDNAFTNSKWKGILPVIGEYYTWRADCPDSESHGYVEEIVSPIAPTGFEYSHAKDWYKKMDIEVNINELIEESKLVNI